jgi:LPXTG-motif cell wall-anchored protein
LKVKRIVHLLLVMLLISSFFTSMVSANEDAEKLSLVSLGDSITYGLNLNDPTSEAFPNFIGPDLFNVTNLAYPGWTSTDLLNALQNNPVYTSSLEGADLITLNIGNNDLLQAVKFGELVRGERELNPIELAQAVEAAWIEIAQNLTRIFQFIRSHTDAPILFYSIYNPTVLGESEFEQNFHFLADQMAKSINENVINLFNSEQFGIFVLDAFSAYSGKQAQYLLPLDIHPNLDGHYVLAGLANAFLENFLQPPVDKELVLELTPSTTEDTYGPVTISVSANQPLLQTKWLAGEKTLADFVTAGNEFQGQFEATENGTYTVVGLSSEGLYGLAVITIENIVTEEAPVEEPVVEQPIEEKPVEEEPVVEVPGIEEPVDEEPTEEAPPGKEVKTPTKKVKDKKVETGDKGNKLPNTATPLYNLILLGLTLLILGSISFYLQQRKKVRA